MSDEQSTIGFIGLGIMGRSMALNLQKAGFPLVVFNRTPGKAQALIDAGNVVEVRSPKEVAEKASIVIAIVTDTPDVEAVLFGENGVSDGAKRGSLFIDMSTISPDATRLFAARLAEQGVGYLDAPVSGGDTGAKNATLTIMVGGEASDYQRAMPVFQAMGKRITHVGPAGAGQVVKSCNQVLVAMNLIGVCESLALAASAGIDAETMLKVVTGGAANSWALENLGPRIARGDLEPGFMVKLIQKDLAIVLKAAGEAKLPLPGTALAVQHFRSVEAGGGGELGTQAMIKVYESLAHRKFS